MAKAGVKRRKRRRIGGSGDDLLSLFLRDSSPCEDANDEEWVIDVTNGTVSLKRIEASNLS